MTTKIATVPLYLRVSLMALAVAPGEMTPSWYYGLSYEDHFRRVAVFHLIPLNLLVRALRWGEFLWARIRCRPSWFDAQIVEAVTEHARTRDAREEAAEEAAYQRGVRRGLRSAVTMLDSANGAPRTEPWGRIADNLHRQASGGAPLRGEDDPGRNDSADWFATAPAKLFEDVPELEAGGSR